jgi:hypothetical protein
MKSYKVLFLVVIIVVAATAMSRLRGQSQNNRASPKQDNQKKIAEDFYTITDYDVPEPTEPRKRTLKLARGKRNNMRFQNSKDAKRFTITEGTESSLGGPPLDVPPEPALPAAQSDALVIGEVTDAKAFLSEDKTSIYSEFTVNISEVLKNSCSAQLAPGHSVDTERYGGAVSIR